MITADDIRTLKGAAIDNEETEAIKAFLENKRRNGGDLYLTEEEFHRILRWKLGRQLGRVRHLLVQNTPDQIETTTRLAFSPAADGRGDELEYKFKILTTIRGVGTGVASAILALAYPDKYCVIDYRGWYQVFGEEKSVFSLRDHKRYIDAILKLAEQLQWSPQEVDLAVWEYDRRYHNK